MAHLKTKKLSTVVLKFLIITVVLTAIGYIIGLDQSNILMNKEGLTLTAITLLIFYIAINYEFFSSTRSNFYSEDYVALFTISFIGMSIMFYFPTIFFYNYLYWACLILWTILGTVKIHSQQKSNNVALNYFLPIWGVSTSFITIGTTFFDFSTGPIRDFSSIKYLVDIRWVTLVMLFISIIILAAIKVRREYQSIDTNIESQNNDSVSHEENSGVKDILYAFFEVFKVISLAIKTSVQFLFAVGVEMIYQILIIAKNIKATLAFTFQMTIVLGAIYICKVNAWVIQFYILENNWLPNLIYFGYLFSNVCFLILCIDGFLRLESCGYINERFKFQKIKYRISRGYRIDELLYIIFSLVATGLLLFGINRIFFPTVKAYYNSGPITILLCIAILVGIVYALIGILKGHTNKQTIGWAFKRRDVDQDENINEDEKVPN
jgi:hypothetical protein